ncbi:ABC transporter permease [Streptomyces sp. NPDC051940]|uniref:ABC transporter permease n=1 Tax=Streptomyces sp. NPDC051940 TaxID=3155675 RepID=UPI003436CE50
MAELAAGVRGYALVAAMWVRSTMAYRASFALNALGHFAICFLDFATIVIMFSHIDTLAGFSLAGMAVLYGATGLSLGLADLVLGNIERIGTRVRDGTLDTLLVRPVPVYAQIAADRFALRRLGRVTQASLVLGWGLWAADVAWTPTAVVLVPVMVLAGAGIYGAVFTLGAAFQFWAGDAAEVQASFTYGGNTLLQYPPGVFAKDVVRGVTYVLPLAFVNWLPALRILGRPDPLGLPGWVDFASPLVAVLCGAVAALAWRAGLRSYRSTGS